MPPVRLRRYSPVAFLQIIIDDLLVLDGVFNKFIILLVSEILCFRVYL